jgi:hypothetical protein
MESNPYSKKENENQEIESQEKINSLTKISNPKI